jgi:hypothetical protein
VSTDLEARLRAELRAAARQVRPEMLRGLPEAGAARGRRPGAIRWLAPVMTVLAVLGVLTGVRLAAGGSAEPSPVSPGAMPRYYVSGENFPGVAHHDKIRVQLSATGAVVSRLALPIGVQVTRITAAASGRLFVVSVNQSSGRLSGTTFWTVTVPSGGRPVRYRQLPVSVPFSLATAREAGAIALSADGSLLAVALQAVPLPGHTKRISQIELISMRTDRVVRTWSGQPGWNLGDVSWVRGDQSVAFNYLTTTEGSDGVVHYFRWLRVLDLARPGTSLAASSAPSPLRVSTQLLRDAISVDGGSQYLVWTEILPPVHRRDDWVLAAYDARTGRRLRVLVNLSGLVQADPMSLSADPSGRHLLITAYGSFTLPGRPRPSARALPPAGQELVMLSNGRLTSRQVPSNALGLLAVW